MDRYRSRPTEIEAVQWFGDNHDEVKLMGAYKFAIVVDEPGPPRGMLFAGKDGAQGWVDVPVGHWIVRQPGDFTDLWPVDPDYFIEKYVQV